MSRLTHSLLVSSATLLIAVAQFGSTDSVFAGEPDWSTIEPIKVTMFYPGVTSWDFLLSEDHGTGAKPVKKGSKSCADCHVNKKGEFDIIADEIVTGELTMSATEAPFEPKPHDGLEGYKDVFVKASHDDEYIYIMLTWPSNGVGASKPDMADTVSIQLTDKIKSFTKYGCYMTCHDNQIDMPKYRGNKQKLYTYYSHSKGKAKGQDKLDGYLAKGQIVDLWIAEFNGEAVNVRDEYILNDRFEDAADLEASGAYGDGNYSVVFKRKLDTAGEGDIQFNKDGTVSIAIAVHDEGAGTRKHYTSFPLTLKLDAEADLVVAKQ